MNLKLPSIRQIGAKIAKLIRRFHIILFTIFVIAGVVIAIFLLNTLLDNPDNATTPAPVTTTQFDQATIDRIDKLNAAGSGQDNFSTPPGRINPFVE